MPRNKRKKKFKVKVGRGGNVSLTSRPLRGAGGAAAGARRRVVKVSVKNKELSELGGRPL